MAVYPEKEDMIKVEVFRDPYRGLFESKINRITDDNISIGPLAINELEYVPLIQGDYLQVYFHRSDALYEFKSSVVEYSGGISTIKITKPPEKNICRFQRRGYLRANCNADAKFTVGKIKKTYDANIINISAGGTLMQSKYAVSPKDILDIAIRINTDNIKKDIQVSGEVSRIERSDLFAVRFTNISDSDVKIIMNVADDYCRKLRKKLMFIK